MVGDLSVWCTSALASIARGLAADRYWKPKLAQARRPASRAGVHLAILVEPFLGFVLDGSKTVESRFSIRKFAPYGHVDPDDIILLKAASGPVVGICRVEQTWYFELGTRVRLESIRRDFAGPMKAEADDFWDARKSASFVSLMRLSGVRALEMPLSCPKRDRRGWVVLRGMQRDLLALQQ